jgi:minor extracellular serine protease Vpr
MLNKILQLTLCCLFILTNINLMAQAQLSNSSSLFLLKAEKLTAEKTEKQAVIKDIKAVFPVSNKKGTYYVGGLMTVSDDFDESALTDLGGKVGTRGPVIYTFRVPVEKFEAMTKLPGITYIQVDRKVKKKLDAALAETNVTAVHLGTDLPQAFTGEGVVVGVIDGGLDMTHPTFRDAAGDLRIKGVWAQAVDVGDPPAGYDYGTELTDPAEMLGIGQTSDAASHGTHVSSIAVGRGVNNGMFSGVAKDADIVFVEGDFDGQGASGIVDAINYIFNYAESVGKPAVINMSLGHHIGPHDGSSLFDQFIDGVVGEGKIIIGSVSNEGDRPVHIGYDLQANDTLRSFVESYNTGGGANISIWGQPGASFEVAIKFTDFSTGNVVGTTSFFPSSTDAMEEIEFSGGDASVSIAVDDSSPLNSKPTIQVSIEVSDSLSLQILPELILTGTTGSLHLWCEAGLENFMAPGYTKGDSDISCNEIGGTAQNIIAVGAYTTTTSFVGLDGETHEADGAEVGVLGPFSSHGPTVDGRTKPEITAPGDVVIAAVNAEFPGVAESYPPAFEYEEGGDSWLFGGATGTSMSAPMVAGIVALILEANPNLSFEEVKDILITTARTDSFTGTIPAEGSNLWGWGKVDAMAAVLAAIDLVPTEDILKNGKAIQIFPNPTTGMVSILLEEESGDATILVTDVAGKLVWSENWTGGNGSFKDVDLSFLNGGIYFITLRGADVMTTSRIVKH